MVKKSRYSYPETVTCLSAAIVDAGNTIFAAVDQSAAATRGGLTLRPTSLIVFGNPKGGTPVMDAFPLFALELPLKLLVWEDDGDGTVNVAYSQMSEIAQRYFEMRRRRTRHASACWTTVPCGGRNSTTASTYKRCSTKSRVRAPTLL